MHSPHTASRRFNTSSNQLTRYLPSVQNLEDQKNQALYNKFSTLEQIAKSIQIQKQKFDQQVYDFNQRLMQCHNVIGKGKITCSQIKDKIQGIRFGQQFQGSGFLNQNRMPIFELDSITYTLNQKPKFLISTVKKQQTQILYSEIQKLQKQCAKLYLNQNQVCFLCYAQKLLFFQKDLFMEFDKISDKVNKKNERSQQVALQVKFAKDQQKLRLKIMQWEKSLNSRFQEKVLRIIEKIQNAAV